MKARGVHGPGQRLTEDEIASIKELIRQGFTNLETGRRMGCTEQTIAKYRAKLAGRVMAYASQATKKLKLDIPKPFPVKPHMMSGITLEQLMSGRARTRRAA